MTSASPGDHAIEVLHSVTTALENSESRVGQDEMTFAIAQSLSQGKSIVVQAGTGTGKSLGYLVPILLSGKKTVVATATKALQDLSLIHI